MIKTPLSTVIGGVGMYTKNSLIIGGGKTEPPFDPATLFENGEIGTLLDATDLSTIYQDAAGTTQTTSGQPIGFILSKTKNKEFGPDLTKLESADDKWIINGAPANGSVTKIGSDILFTTNGNGLLAYIFGGLLTTSYYMFSITISELEGILYLENGEGGASIRIDKTGTHTCIAQNKSSYYLRNNGNSIVNARITDTSIKEIYGYHAIQKTTSARPLLQNNIKFDGIDDALNIAFPSALTNCTIFTVKHGGQAQILEAQSVAQNHTINQDFKYYGIVNRALTGEERASLVNYLDKLGAQ